MAWWQKKLLRYALSRTGLLDDNDLNLDNLDITFGTRNVVELKDVSLNIKRISKLAQLPPALRIETARVLSLRLTVPADIYQSGIVAEVDGVVVGVRVEEGDGAKAVGTRPESRDKGREGRGSHQHRKVHRRLRSPPPYDPGGESDEGEETYIPTAQELAKSFLLDEPVQDRRQLEGELALKEKGLEESFASESSDSTELGTGATVGLPGFLAGFLQGIVDRLEVRVKNLVVTLETEVGEGEEAVPVALKLGVGFAGLEKVDGGVEGMDGRRKINFSEITLDVVSDAEVFAELSEAPSRSSPVMSPRSPVSSPLARASTGGSVEPQALSSHRSVASGQSARISQASSKSPDVMRASAATADSDRFADAGDEDQNLRSLEASLSELDIQPGDDNISWGSRRSKSSAPRQDLWQSITSDDGLPQSLLLERAPTPRASLSRGNSPETSRSRRNVSPYARNLQSPGSWPTVDDHVEPWNLRQSPGSWPTLYQTEQSMFQPVTPAQERPFGAPVDNKRIAVEASIMDTPVPKDKHEDLAASRLFTHEEAQSMYMSAMSHDPQMHIPGGWGSEDSPSDRSSSPEQPRYSTPARAAPAPSGGLRPSTIRAPTYDDDDLAYGERPYSTPQAPLSGNVTPRPRSPVREDPDVPGPESARNVSKQLVHVDTLSLLLPSNSSTVADDRELESPQRMSASRSYAPRGMPGTFSAYSDMAASRRKLDASVSFAAPAGQSEGPGVSDAAKAVGSPLPLGVEVGTIDCQVDLACSRLLYRLAVAGKVVMDGVSPNSSAQASGAQSAPTHPLSVSVKAILVAVQDMHNGNTADRQSRGPDQHPSLTLACLNIAFTQEVSEKSLRIGTLEASVGNSPLLSFDRNHNLDASVLVTERTPDIVLTISNKLSTVKRPITETSIDTLPLKLLIDLPEIDEALGSFGGLSGVLDVGNSILSDSGFGNTSGSPIKPSKGVRFEGQPEYLGVEPETKINARFGGLSARLQGSACSILLQTSTIKVVYREVGAVVKVEHVQVSGPYMDADSVPAVNVDVSALRLEYLPSPQDKDLERMLFLLTPSNDPYDTDDDILLDTLIRQRRKGAVARVNVGMIKAKCLDWAALDTISSLGSDMGKLSAVTKYLPEDDRPGVLTLIRITEAEARLPVNERFGSLDVNLTNFDCAQVGLPTLLALSIESIKASQSGGVELVHPLVPTASVGNLPMVMMRMLGEYEPLVKVKLFNVAIEYSVPVLLDMTGMDLEAGTEKIVTDLAYSVADLVKSKKETPIKEPASPSEGRSTSSKTMKLDLLLHDAALGLSPQHSSNKGLLVFADVKFATNLPPEAKAMAMIELSKAGLFVADTVVPNPDPKAPIARNTPNNTAVKPKLTSELSKQGYVSVGSLMSARVIVSAEEGTADGTRSIDVDVTTKLILLETCADSTQTLISVMNGLAPPTPPSKTPKYLTEPMAIEEMMASFIGETYTKPAPAPQTLFDVEDEDEGDADRFFNMAGFEEDDDGLLAESEMTSSLYGPVDGVFGVGDEEASEADQGSEYFAATAESLLEDDPFEMTITPADAPMSDAALVRELSKQSKPAINEDLVDLGLYEIEDLGFDALGGNQSVLGGQHRFNTPATSAKRLPRGATVQKLPFKLKLRDLHIIWNIYDGYDWQRTREGITDAVEQVEQRAEQRKAKRRRSQAQSDDEESVIGDFLFNSIYIGVPSNQDAQDLRRQINRHIDDMASETESVPVSGMSRPSTYSAPGRSRPRRRLKLERSRTHKIAFELKGVSADVLVFPPDSVDIVSSVDVRVRDMEIFDNVPTSTWRKFLTHLDTDANGREIMKPMVHMELLNVRTLENYAAAELALHVTVLPLRLHVDQDALDFITRFFEFKDDAATPPSSGGDQPFLQRVEVETVDLRLDYKPKKVDYVGLRSGHTNEFMNFVILDAANIRLKHAIIYGIKGFEPLHKTLNDIWMPDVKRNQLPTVLAGLAPVRSLVNIGTGVRDVVAIPIREYRKDGRIVRSIQKGAFHFGKTTASELARLGAKVAIGTQNLLQGAEGMLAPSSSSSPGGRLSSRRSPSDHGWHDIDEEDASPERRAISSYANQPLGVFGGLRSARRYLEHDLLTARDALIAVQGEIMESEGPSGAVAAVVRHAPTVILRPIIGTTRAVGTALLGVGNAIDSEGLKRVDDVS